MSLGQQLMTTMLGTGAALLLACARPVPADEPPAREDPARAPASNPASTMVSEQIAARGIRDPRVLAALRTVPRDEFVPPMLRAAAWEDHPLPIGHEQTISQPYIVALMTELAQVGPGSRVLEIGTGSGYQAAVLAACGAEVWTIEIVPELAEQAALALARLGYDRVHVRAGDGSHGWPEEAPFDAILVTAAPEELPRALRSQLAPGGRLVAPVGREDDQTLQVHHRTDDGFRVERIAAVRFVPMTGDAAR
jgi:protein-L-isoaspartate(D-aspartate) O-methyltransferase